MCFKLTKTKGVQVIRLTENITFSNARVFRDFLEERIESDPASIIIDLKKVNFINSTGIGVLAAAHSTLKDSDRKLVLLNVRPEVVRVLQIIGFDSLILMTDDEDEAMSACL